MGIKDIIENSSAIRGGSLGASEVYANQLAKAPSEEELRLLKLEAERRERTYQAQSVISQVLELAKSIMIANPNLMGEQCYDLAFDAVEKWAVRAKADLEKAMED